MSWNDDDLNTIRLFEKLGTINNVVQHVLAHSFGKNGLTPVHFEGNIIINNQKEKNIKTNYEYDFDITVKVLLDTGALCANYMSKNLYEDIRNQLNDHDIRQQKTCISLADDSKKITSDCAVTLTIDILDQKSSTNKLYKGEFVVINMRDNDVIIGLPAILSDLWEFFKTSIESNKRSLTHLHAIEEDDDLLEPWEHMDVTEAPEEEEAPLPVLQPFESCHVRKPFKTTKTCLMNTLTQTSERIPISMQCYSARGSKCLYRIIGRASKESNHSRLSLMLISPKQSNPQVDR